MACIAIIGTLWVGATGRQLRLVRLHRQWQLERQAAWLLEAGLDRARAQLTRDVTYLGEEWKPIVQAGSQHHAASIGIAVQQQSTDRVRVQVVVKYPVTPVSSALTISKAAVYTMAAPGDGAFEQEDLR